MECEGMQYVMVECEGMVAWVWGHGALGSAHLPEVIYSVPNTSSSATLPPMATSSLASSCLLLHDSSSFSDIWATYMRSDHVMTTRRPHMMR